MLLEQRRQAMLHYIWMINNFIAYLGLTYIRDSTVIKLQHDTEFQKKSCTATCIAGVWLKAYYIHKTSRLFGNNEGYYITKTIIREPYHLVGVTAISVKSSLQ